MKKLKAELRAIHEGLSHFKYTNSIVLIIIFLTGFLLSAVIYQSRYNAAYTNTFVQGYGGKGLDGPPLQEPIDWTKSGGGPGGGGTNQGAPAGQTSNTQSPDTQSHRISIMDRKYKGNPIQTITRIKTSTMFLLISKVITSRLLIMI